MPNYDPVGPPASQNRKTSSEPWSQRMLISSSDHGNLLRPVDYRDEGIRFAFQPTSSGTTSIAHMEYEKELELSVGGDGIIGRRVSVFTDDGSRVLLAEGVVGWN